jgi:hypothetical protein
MPAELDDVERRPEGQPSSPTAVKAGLKYVEALDAPMALVPRFDNDFVGRIRSFEEGADLPRDVRILRINLPPFPGAI